MPLNLAYQPGDIHSRVRRAGDKSPASIRLLLIKQIDLENITAATGSSKLRGSVNKAGRRKKFHKHWHLMSGLRKKINTPTPRRTTVVFVKYQVTITFTRLLEAHDSIIWAETTYYRPRVMNVVCLFCDQFAELIVFAVQYWRKWNGFILCLSFLSASCVQDSSPGLSNEQTHETSSSQHQTRLYCKRKPHYSWPAFILFLCYD